MKKIDEMIIKKELEVRINKIRWFGLFFKLSSSQLPKLPTNLIKKKNKIIYLI